LGLNAQIAPICCAIFPLLDDDLMIQKVIFIGSKLKKLKITTKIDSTAISIGRRYSRADEIGIPFAITVDHATLSDNIVTIRDRDSTEQICVPLDKVCDTILSLVHEQITWKFLKLHFILK